MPYNQDKFEDAKRAEKTLKDELMKHETDTAKFKDDLDVYVSAWEDGGEDVTLTKKELIEDFQLARKHM